MPEEMGGFGASADQFFIYFLLPCGVIQSPDLRVVKSSKCQDVENAKERSESYAADLLLLKSRPAKSTSRSATFGLSKM